MSASQGQGKLQSVRGNSEGFDLNGSPDIEVQLYMWCTFIRIKVVL